MPSLKIRFREKSTQPGIVNPWMRARSQKEVEAYSKAHKLVVLEVEED
jgi:hypothetical protein